MYSTLIHQGLLTGGQPGYHWRASTVTARTRRTAARRGAARLRARPPASAAWVGPVDHRVCSGSDCPSEIILHDDTFEQPGSVRTLHRGAMFSYLRAPIDPNVAQFQRRLVYVQLDAIAKAVVRDLQVMG